MNAIRLVFAFALIGNALACSQLGCDGGHTNFAPNVVGPSRFNAVLTGFTSSLVGGTEEFVVNEELNIAVRHGTSSQRLEIYDLNTGVALWKTKPMDQRSPSYAGFINLGWNTVGLIVPPGSGRTPSVVGVEVRCTELADGSYRDECIAVQWDVVAFAPRTGQELWRTKVSERLQTRITAPVADNAGNVYIVSLDINVSGPFNVTAVSNSGQLLWHKAFSSREYTITSANNIYSMQAAVSESRQLVFVPHMYGVVGLSMATGEKSWDGTNPPDVFNCGRVIVSDGDGKVLCSALYAKSVPAWNLADASIAWTAVFWDDNSNYQDNFVWAVDPVHHRLVITRWQHAICFSMVDGRLLWTRDAIRDVRGIAIDREGSMFMSSALATDPSWIFKFDGATGTLITRQPIRASPFSSLVLTTRGLYLCSNDMVLYINDFRPPSTPRPPRSSPSPTPLPPPISSNVPHPPTNSAWHLPGTPAADGNINLEPSADLNGQTMHPAAVFGISFGVSTVLAIVVGAYFIRKSAEPVSPYAYSQFR